MTIHSLNATAILCFWNAINIIKVSIDESHENLVGISWDLLQTVF